MVLLLLMVVQVGVWYHTRAVAQTAARHGLDHVRTINGSPSEGIDVASEFLDQSGGGLENRN
ncbi:MAG: pilus assembly protein, partial [Acidimicrobiales bacterium]|nr:pilus assembly protein [Acidimicrobiales bacterium]